MNKILVVDDDVDNLIAMKDAIESCMEDCSVLAALSGKEGLELARKELPDTIILDIVMPGIDGYEVCIQLKGDLATKHIPVILLSAIRKDTESKLKGYEAGADIFLTKPIESEILFGKIQEMLHL